MVNSFREDDEDIFEAIQKAKIFGQQVYKDAVSHTKVTESGKSHQYAST